MIAIKRLTSSDSDFRARLDALLAFEAAQDQSVDECGRGHSCRCQGTR